MLERGLLVDHTTIYHWVQHYAPELDRRFRSQLKITTDSWKVDETYIKIVRRINGRKEVQQKAVRTVGKSFTHLVYPCQMA
jgi:transposase-like protein